MVEPPSPEAEDRRRLTRERGTLLKERIQHTNRIRGLLFGQGITDYDPLRKDRRSRLSQLTTGDGRPLPDRLKAQIARELDRLELVVSQLSTVERERETLVAEITEADFELRRRRFCGFAELAPNSHRFCGSRGCSVASTIAVKLRPMQAWRRARGRAGEPTASRASPRLGTRGCGMRWSSSRGSGSAISQVRTSAAGLSRASARAVVGSGGSIVALARKLLVALWRYVTQGVVPQGAVFKA